MSEKARVLVLTYAAELLFYVLRKVPSVVKADWERELGVSVAGLGAIDTLFLAAYTIGAFAAGPAGDRLGGKAMLVAALAGSAACAVWLSLATSVRTLFIASFAHGLCQAVSCPSCVKLLSVWVPNGPANSTLLGLWGTNTAFGGLAGVIAGTWLSQHYGWQVAFYATVAPLLAAAGFTWCCVSEDPPTPTEPQRTPHTPAELKLAVSLKPQSPAVVVTAAQSASSAGGGMASALCRTLALPGVAPLCVGYFFLKFCRYAIMLWLPYYYHVALGHDVESAGYMATGYEIGSLPGPLALCFVAEKLMNGDRTLTACVFCMLSGALLLAHVFLVQSDIGGVILMGVVGLTVSGSDFALPTLCTQDIAGRLQLPKSSGIGVSSIVGAVIGAGSLGTVLQGPVCARVSTAYGWNTVFLLLVSVNGVTALVLYTSSRCSPLPGRSPVESTISSPVRPRTPLVLPEPAP
eukprot:TRINITY_DN24069_c0_g2_i1.p1 TRINITY_DN24069_c0_g2~~TRINITY_DN24069_c0_g2_i1.p1  ORF type:complete len:463 (+),score=98.37 TRINITY_DN24069_c0_g2_i1:126-1514(+)